MASQTTLSELRQRLSGQQAEQPSRNCFSTGITALDRILPDGGWRRGSLVEWLSEAGAGAVELAFRSLAADRQPNCTWCVIDPEATFFALPALSGAPKHLLVIRPQTTGELWWAMEQVLRCPSVGITWCQIESVPERVLRRWQLAVEAGRGIGMLFRPVSSAGSRSWSDLRLSVTPVKNHSRFSRRLRVEVLSCRGRLGGQAVMLELHHAPDGMSLVSELDDSAVVADRTRYSLRCAGRVG